MNHQAVNLLKAVICSKASAWHKSMSPEAAADMIYSIGGSAVAEVEKITKTSYETDGGDAACELMAKWITEDRKAVRS